MKKKKYEIVFAEINAFEPAEIVEAESEEEARRLGEEIAGEKQESNSSFIVASVNEVEED